MKPKHSSRQRPGLIFVAFAAAGLSQSAQAAAYDWIGATNATWDVGWTGANVPAISDDLTILGPSNSAALLNIDVASNAFAKTINFTNMFAATLTNTTSGANKTLTLQNGLTTGTGAVTIGSATSNQGVLIALGASQIWNIGSGGLTANNIISGTGFGITKTGAGTLTLSGANTYSGGTTVSQGTLLVGNTAGTGTGAITLNGGTFGTSAGFATIVNNIVAATGTASTIGGTGSAFMIYNGQLSGSGSLQISNSTFGILNGNQSNYTGAISVGGTGRLAVATAANNQSNLINLSKASVTLASGGSIGFESGGGTAHTGTFLLGSLSSDAGVGSIGNAGTVKTAAFQIGFLNTDTTFGGAVGIAAIGNLTKVGTGTLTLNGAATSNLMAGGITIRGGTLQLGDGSATVGGFSSANNALTFGDSGRFNYQGVSTGSSQGMATTTFTTGAGTVQSTYGTSGNTSLTLANVAARAAGATGNFVVSGGTNGSTNKIVFTQVAGATPTTSALLDKGYYFNGADYAACGTGGFVRALAYGTDTNAAAVDTITAGNHVKVTGTPSAQNSISLLTLNLAGGGVSWTNNAAQTLTLSGGGLIKSGGGAAATISGGTGLTAGATEFVVRADTASDSLDIQTALLSSSTGGLTKNGAGTLMLSATGNAYTGATYVNEGTLKITGTASSGSGIVNVNNSGVFEVSGSGSFTTTGTMTVGQRSGNGTVNLTGGSLSVGTLTISNSTVASDSAAGVVNVTGGVLTSINDVTVGLGGTQTGKLVIDGGTVNVGTTALKWLKLGQWDTSNGQLDINNGALNLNTNSVIKFNVNSGSGTNVINQNGGTVTSYSGNGTGTAGSATDGAIDMQTASNTLVNNTYNLNGGTLTINRVFSTSTNGTRTFNFNGGTLKAASGLATTFFDLGAGTARANVRNGGAIIDTNGFNVTIAQALVHSNINGDNATDGGLTKNNTGTASTLTLSGANTYTGATTVNAGTLKAGVASFANVSGAFGNNSAVTMANVAGATLDIAGFNTQIGSLAGGGTTGGNVTLGAATLTIGGANQSGTYAGAISSIGTPATSLIKVGTGSQILSGANTYTGATAVNAGTLQFARTASLYAGSTGSWTAANITAASGATLAMNVGGNGEFAATDVNTLLTNISVASSPTTGLQAGAKLGFDTTNATGGIFSQGNAILDSTGTNGGAVGVTKLGTSTLVLDKTNTYTGATAVQLGKLVVSGSIDNSAVTVTGTNTTLASGATGTIGSSVTMNSGTILAAGDVSAVGTATIGIGGLAMGSGSIFEWDLQAASATDPGVVSDASTGSYDKIVTSGAVTGTSIFKVVLAGNSFTDAFWDTNKSWTNIFTGAGAPSDLSAIFTTFSGSGGIDSTGLVAGQGQFTFNGSSTLSWSAVPEPTSALAGLLVGAGLLRRSRRREG